MEKETQSSNGSGANQKKKNIAAVVWIGIMLVAAGVAAFLLFHTPESKTDDRSVEAKGKETQQAIATDIVTEAKSNTEAGTLSEPATEDSTKSTEHQIDFDKIDTTVMQNADVKNLLLIGQDRRPGQGRQRSDCMIICSINNKTGKITLCSLMRDMYVPIPGHPNNRINAAYIYGGMELLDQVIEESFGIHIDGNIEVDFDGFVKAMGVVGTFDIELKAEEAEFMNTSDWSKGSGFDVASWNLHEGVNALTPEQVLVYSRIRYVGHSDWERTERQRKVLTAIFNKLKSEEVSKILDEAGEVIQYVTTDLMPDELMGYVYTIADGNIDMGENYRIPVDGTYTSETIEGKSVLVPSLSKNAEYLKEYLYGE